MKRRTAPPKATDKPDKVYFSNKRFTVTRHRLSTKLDYYPISDTVGRRRKDIQFAALAFSGLVGVALWRYFDLWYPHELFIMGGAILLALLIGTQFSILQIDARGFPSRMYVGRSKTLRSVFDAITQAKTERHEGRAGYSGRTRHRRSCLEIGSYSYFS